MKPGFLPPMRALPSGWSYRAVTSGVRVRDAEGLTFTAPHDVLADIDDWESGEIGDGALLARLALHR